MCAAAHLHVILTPLSFVYSFSVSHYNLSVCPEISTKIARLIKVYMAQLFSLSLLARVNTYQLKMSRWLESSCCEEKEAMMTKEGTDVFMTSHVSSGHFRLSFSIKTRLRIYSLAL